MNRMERIAFDTAKEIVVAKMATTSPTTNRETGKAVGEYFEEIYKKLLEIIPDTPDRD